MQPNLSKMTVSELKHLIQRYQDELNLYPPSSSRHQQLAGYLSKTQAELNDRKPHPRHEI